MKVLPKEAAPAKPPPRAVEIPVAAVADDFDPVFDNCLSHLGEFRQLVEADRRRLDEDLRRSPRTGGSNHGQTAADPAPLAEGLTQLERLREGILDEIEMLQHNERSRARARAAQAPDSGAASKKPAPPQKSRGTFPGLRRWLTGEGGK